MGGNKGKNTISNKWNCFHCGESGHWVQDCYLKDHECVKGCGNKMKLFWSSKPTSVNCRFLKCPNVNCRAFAWVDTPYSSNNNIGNEEEHSSSSNAVEVKKESNKNLKVTVEENGKKITFEGEVEVVIDVLNKKFNI